MFDRREMQKSETMGAAAAAARPTRSLTAYLGLMLRGVAMGAADVVPGVSGGTMAFILGIYEELIDSIRAVGQPPFIKAVLGFRIKEIFAILNWKFLLAVGTGILVAIFSLASILEYLLENRPVYIWSFFFGLVLASVFTVSKRIGRWGSAAITAGILAAIGAYILVGLVPAQTTNAWWFLILSGAIAICAMILPGISGSFILVLLGKYQYVLGAVNDRDFVTLGLVAFGALIGIVSIAQVLGWLFKNYHDVTVAALIGLMFGSLRKVWPWKVDVAWLTDAAGNFVLSDGHRIVTEQHNVLPTPAVNGGGEIGMALLLALVGFGLVIVIERLANQK